MFWVKEFWKEIVRRGLKEVSQSSEHQGYSSQQYHQHAVGYSAHFFLTEISEVDLETISSGTGSVWNRLRKEVQHLRKMLKDSMRSKRISDRAHLSIFNQTSLNHPQHFFCSLECFDFQRFGRYSNWNIWNQGLNCVCFVARSRKLNG